MWNHRVCKEDKEGTILYNIREVFYNTDGTIYAISNDSSQPLVWTEEEDTEEGEILSDLEEQIRWFLKAVSHPVIDLATVEYTDMDEL